ncbi:MAG: thiamine transport system ATP-binding protein [Thermoplasmata archaeon]|jgi:ABC-type Fe3+/spermidine/putrescine transport system ATPase subunit|nr:thiamine transport system ATP-binding protein [Thermoplasmata archaeon]
MSLRAVGLRFTYPGWPPTLDSASLEVPAGESGFLLGPSGSGKSTLLRLLAGLEHPDAGQVLLDGADVTALPAHRRRIGLMFQEPALFPHLTVAGNVGFPMPYAGVPRRDRAAEVRRLLDTVGLADKAGARVDELSGGQRSRVALARALAARPRALLLDEPLASLDRPLRQALGDEVKRILAERKVAALWVTHDEDEAARLADRAWRLVDGRCEPVQKA